ncbi:conserved Plasmodium protein, unknown function [Plasmodium sp. gorilla clade G2]|uniref:conserved Plasmodium protein, unknown function n=1 Tax=Plasmodium sp. gorilla clade G2 TaxID=880535 RepID=UPI000D22C2E1|nr:conserved Plasmodium protein, unknown function [Plasmodium sp. gorilla clade G2]SOV11900.1 conserved Plasmodium protein, unknown function [Plasmodium sp. gorilla clade G2]
MGKSKKRTVKVIDPDAPLEYKGSPIEECVHNKSTRAISLVHAVIESFGKNIQCFRNLIICSYKYRRMLRITANKFDEIHDMLKAVIYQILNNFILRFTIFNVFWLRKWAEDSYRLTGSFGKFSFNITKNTISLFLDMYKQLKDISNVHMPDLVKKVYCLDDKYKAQAVECSEEVNAESVVYRYSLIELIELDFYEYYKENFYLYNTIWPVEIRNKSPDLTTDSKGRVVIPWIVFGNSFNFYLFVFNILTFFQWFVFEVKSFLVHVSGLIKWLNIIENKQVTIRYMFCAYSLKNVAADVKEGIVFIGNKVSQIVEKRLPCLPRIQNVACKILDIDMNVQKVQKKVEENIEPKIEPKIERKVEIKVEIKVEKKVEKKVEMKAEIKAENVLMEDIVKDWRLSLYDKSKIIALLALLYNENESSSDEYLDVNRDRIIDLLFFLYKNCIEKKDLELSVRSKITDILCLLYEVDSTVSEDDKLIRKYVIEILSVLLKKKYKNEPFFKIKRKKVIDLIYFFFVTKDKKAEVSDVNKMMIEKNSGKSFGTIIEILEQRLNDINPNVKMVNEKKNENLLSVDDDMVTDIPKEEEIKELEAVVQIKENELIEAVETAKIAKLDETAKIAKLDDTAKIAKLVETAKIAKVDETAKIAKVVEEVEIAKVVEEAEIAKVVEEVEIAKVVEEAEIAKVVEEVEIANTCKVPPKPVVPKSKKKKRRLKKSQNITKSQCLFSDGEIVNNDSSDISVKVNSKKNVAAIISKKNVVPEASSQINDKDKADDLIKTVIKKKVIHDDSSEESEKEVIVKQVVKNEVVRNEAVENNVVESKVVESKVVENNVVENNVVENNVVENNVVENNVVDNEDTDYPCYPADKKLIIYYEVDNEVVENEDKCLCLDDNVVAVNEDADYPCYPEDKKLIIYYEVDNEDKCLCLDDNVVAVNEDEDYPCYPADKKLIIYYEVDNEVVENEDKCLCLDDKVVDDYEDIYYPCYTEDQEIIIYYEVDNEVVENEDKCLTLDDKVVDDYEDIYYPCYTEDQEIIIYYEVDDEVVVNEEICSTSDKNVVATSVVDCEQVVNKDKCSSSEKNVVATSVVDCEQVVSKDKCSSSDKHVVTTNVVDCEQVVSKETCSTSESKVDITKEFDSARVVNDKICSPVVEKVDEKMTKLNSALKADKNISPSKDEKIVDEVVNKNSNNVDNPSVKTPKKVTFIDTLKQSKNGIKEKLCSFVNKNILRRTPMKKKVISDSSSDNSDCNLSVHSSTSDNETLFDYRKKLIEDILENEENEAVNNNSSCDYKEKVIKAMLGRVKEKEIKEDINICNDVSKTEVAVSNNNSVKPDVVFEVPSTPQLPIINPEDINSNLNAENSVSFIENEPVVNVAPSFCVQSVEKPVSFIENKPVVNVAPSFCVQSVEKPVSFIENKPVVNVAPSFCVQSVEKPVSFIENQPVVNVAPSFFVQSVEKPVSFIENEPVVNVVPSFFVQPVESSPERNCFTKNKRKWLRRRKCRNAYKIVTKCFVKKCRSKKGRRREKRRRIRRIRRRNLRIWVKDKRGNVFKKKKVSMVNSPVVPSSFIMSQKMLDAELKAKIELENFSQHQKQLAHEKVLEEERKLAEQIRIQNEMKLEEERKLEYMRQLELERKIQYEKELEEVRRIERQNELEWKRRIENSKMFIKQQININKENVVVQDNVVISENIINEENVVVSNNVVITKNIINEENVVVPENNFIPENVVTENNYISENVVVSENNIIPENVVVSENIIIPENVVVPENNYISENVVVSENNIIPENIINEDNVVVSENIIIPENVVVSENNIIPENIINEDNVVVSENIIIPENVVVPENNFISENVVVSENNIIPENVVVPENNYISENVVVSENIIIPENIINEENFVVSENIIIPENVVVSENNIIFENIINEENVVSENNFIPENVVVSENNYIPDNVVVPENIVVSETNIFPENVVVSENNIIPETFVVPEINYIAENVVMSENNYIPENVVVPENNYIPENVVVLENNYFPENVVVPENNIIPENFVVPENNYFPENVVVSENNYIPENVVVPEINFIPENVVVPENNYIPENVVVPENNYIPENVVVPEINFIPENVVVPENNYIPENVVVPENNYIPENVVVPEINFIPENVVVPENNYIPENVVMSENITNLENNTNTENYAVRSDDDINEKYVSPPDDMNERNFFKRECDEDYQKIFNEQPGTCANDENTPVYFNDENSMYQQNVLNEEKITKEDVELNNPCVDDQNNAKGENLFTNQFVNEASHNNQVNAEVNNTGDGGAVNVEAEKNVPTGIDDFVNADEFDTESQVSEVNPNENITDSSKESSDSDASCTTYGENQRNRDDERSFDEDYASASVTRSSCSYEEEFVDIDNSDIEYSIMFPNRKRVEYHPYYADMLNNMPFPDTYMIPNPNEFTEHEDYTKLKINYPVMDTLDKIRSYLKEKDAIISYKWKETKGFLFQAVKFFKALKDRVKKKFKYSPRVSTYHYYATRIYELMSTLSFSTCKKVYMYLDDVKPHVLNELARDDFIEQNNTRNLSFEIRKSEKLTTKAIRLHFLICVDYLIESMTIIMDEDNQKALDKYKKSYFNRLGKIVPVYDMKHPCILDLEKLLKGLSVLCFRLDEAKLFIRYCDYDMDRIIRGSTSHLNCFNLIVRHWAFRLERVCTDSGKAWELPNELFPELHKESMIINEARVDKTLRRLKPPVDDKLIIDVLLKYKAAIENGTLRPYDERCIRHPKAMFRVYLCTKLLYDKICEELALYNVEIIINNDLFEVICSKHFGVLHSWERIEKLNKEINEWNIYNLPLLEEVPNLYLDVFKRNSDDEEPRYEAFDRLMEVHLEATRKETEQNYANYLAKCEGVEFVENNEENNNISKVEEVISNVEHVQVQEDVSNVEQVQVQEEVSNVEQVQEEVSNVENIPLNEEKIKVEFCSDVYEAKELTLEEPLVENVQTDETKENSNLFKNLHAFLQKELDESVKNVQTNNNNSLQPQQPLFNNNLTQTISPVPETLECSENYSHLHERPIYGIPELGFQTSKISSLLSKNVQCNTIPSNNLEMSKTQLNLFSSNNLEMNNPQLNLFSSNNLEMNNPQLNLFSSNNLEMNNPQLNLFSSNNLEMNKPQSNLFSSNNLEMNNQQSNLFSSNNLEMNKPQSNLFSSNNLEMNNQQLNLFSSNNLEMNKSELNLFPSNTLGLNNPQLNLFSSNKLDLNKSELNLFSSTNLDLNKPQLNLFSSNKLDLNKSELNLFSSTNLDLNKPQLNLFSSNKLDMNKSELNLFPSNTLDFNKSELNLTPSNKFQSNNKPFDYYAHDIKSQNNYTYEDTQEDPNLLTPSFGNICYDTESQCKDIVDTHQNNSEICTPSFGNEYGVLNSEHNNKLNEIHNNVESKFQTEDNILYNTKSKSLKRGRDNSYDKIKSDSTFLNVVDLEHLQNGVSKKVDLESATYDNIIDEKNKINHIDNKFHSFEKEQSETYEINCDSKNFNDIDVMEFNIYKEGHEEAFKLAKVPSSSSLKEQVDEHFEKESAIVQLENVISYTSEDEMNTVQDIPTNINKEEEKEIIASTEVEVNKSKEEEEVVLEIMASPIDEVKDINSMESSNDILKNNVTNIYNCSLDIRKRKNTTEIPLEESSCEKVVKKVCIVKDDNKEVINNKSRNIQKKKNVKKNKRNMNKKRVLLYKIKISNIESVLNQYDDNLKNIINNNMVPVKAEESTNESEVVKTEDENININININKNIMNDVPITQEEININSDVVESNLIESNNDNNNNYINNNDDVLSNTKDNTSMNSNIVKNPSMVVHYINQIIFFYNSIRYSRFNLSIDLNMINLKNKKSKINTDKLIRSKCIHNRSKGSIIKKYKSMKIKRSVIKKIFMKKIIHKRIENKEDNTVKNMKKIIKKKSNSNNNKKKYMHTTNLIIHYVFSKFYRRNIIKFKKFLRKHKKLSTTKKSTLSNIQEVKEEVKDSTLEIPTPEDNLNVNKRKATTVAVLSSEFLCCRCTKKMCTGHDDSENNVYIKIDVKEKKDVVVDEVKENEVVVDEVKENEVVIDEVKENEVVVDEVKENEVVVDEVKENEVVVDEVKENEVVIDEVKDKNIVSDDVKDKNIVSDDVKEKDVVVDDDVESYIIDKILRECLKEDTNKGAEEYNSMLKSNSRRKRKRFVLDEDLYSGYDRYLYKRDKVCKNKKIVIDNNTPKEKKNENTTKSTLYGYFIKFVKKLTFGYNLNVNRNETSTKNTNENNNNSNTETESGGCITRFMKRIIFGKNRNNENIACKDFKKFTVSERKKIMQEEKVKESRNIFKYFYSRSDHIANYSEEKKVKKVEKNSKHDNKYNNEYVSRHHNKHHNKHHSNHHNKHHSNHHNKHHSKHHNKHHNKNKNQTEQRPSIFKKVYNFLKSLTKKTDTESVPVVSNENNDVNIKNVNVDVPNVVPKSIMKYQNPSKPKRSKSPRKTSDNLKKKIVTFCPKIKRCSHSKQKKLKEKENN